jgi:hypothetical protein
MKTTSYSIVANHPSHEVAEVPIKELQQSGLDLKQCSIIGRDHRTEERLAEEVSEGCRPPQMTMMPTAIPIAPRNSRPIFFPANEDQEKKVPARGIRTDRSANVDVGRSAQQEKTTGFH